MQKTFSNRKIYNFVNQTLRKRKLHINAETYLGHFFTKPGVVSGGATQSTTSIFVWNQPTHFKLSQKVCWDHGHNSTWTTLNTKLICKFKYWRAAYWTFFVSLLRSLSTKKCCTKLIFLNSVSLFTLDDKGFYILLSLAHHVVLVFFGKHPIWLKNNQSF